jgi:hypothetical protein
MSEQAPQVKHSELHLAIDEAAQAANVVGKHQREDYPGGYSEEIHGSNYLGGDAVSTDIGRSDDKWFKNRTNINMHVSRPSNPGEDPYHRARTNYDVKMTGQIGARARIERTNEKGEVVYTHESKDAQLARRIGMVGAKSIVRQSAIRAEARKAA